MYVRTVDEKNIIDDTHRIYITWIVPISLLLLLLLLTWLTLTLTLTVCVCNKTHYMHTRGRIGRAPTKRNGFG